MLSSNDDLDMPQEWLDPVIWLLADDLETEYPVNDPRLALKIERKAADAKQILDYWDTEGTSLFMQPDNAYALKTGASKLQGTIGPWGGARLVNAFTEQSEGDKAELFAVMAIPGLSLFSSVSSLPVRGSHRMGTVLYAVIGTTLYSIDSAGTATLLARSRAPTQFASPITGPSLPSTMGVRRVCLFWRCRHLSG
jgi:hypothetical protein